MNVNNNIVFKGVIGDKFVQEITINHRNVSTDSLLQAAKGKVIGLDTNRVCDIFESFISGLIRETKEKLYLHNRINSLKKEVPERMKEIIKSTEESISTRFENIIADKDQIIRERELQIRDLLKYEAMAKVKSIDEIDTVMPETAISTALEIKEKQAEAEESMLTYLLTGKGQEKALEQVERAQILVKAQEDGIDQIPDVRNVIRDNSISYGEPLHFLQNMMITVLRDEKASVIIAPVFAKQIKTNMMGLLSPHCNKRQYSTSPEGISESVDEHLAYTIKFQKDLAARKLALKKEFPEASKIVYDRVHNKINIYNANGDLTSSNWFC